MQLSDPALTSLHPRIRGRRAFTFSRNQHGVFPQSLPYSHMNATIGAVKLG